jgi:hypothetical protein
MAITNGDFESAGSWIYSEVDAGNKFSGARTTAWAQSGSYSYNISCSGQKSNGDYGQILQSVYIDADTLNGYVRWHTYAGGQMTLKVIIDTTVVWSKIMNLSNPSPPPVEHFNIDVSTYNGTTVDLILRMESTVASDSGWNSWWDLITLVYTDFYVKASGGNDANDGTSWDDADAWATIDKAAKTVVDGSTVHIGFGTYNAEPANNDIAPVNAGAVGIKYLPETAVTGGGTGSVIVEVN